MAKINKTRPSCARVKVLVDLLADHPNKVRMDILNEASGEVRTEWVNIKYDMLPKYCKECRLQGHDDFECWRIHPELSPYDQGKQTSDKVKEQTKVQHNQPLMILSSRRVVGNVKSNGEQWKDVKDNRVKKAGNQVINGKEIVPVNQGDRQQEVAVVNQQDRDNERRQIVSVDVGQQIQTTNKFAALQAEEEGDNGNQMIIVEADVRHDTQRQKDLNPNASVFIPKSTGVASSKRGNVEYDDEEGNIIKEGSNKGKATTVQKEATTAWVNRIFAEKIVATNQSCQDIPSQDTEVDATIKEVNANERLQISGGKLWDAQTEEDSEEGELPEGASGEEESSDEENDEEEQSVNDKANKECQKSETKGGTSKENKADQGEDIEVINQKKTGTGDQPDQKLISSSPIKELPPAKPNIEPDIPFAVDTGTEGVIIHIEGIGEEHGKSKEDAAGDNVKNTKMLQPSDEGQKNSQRSLIPNPIGNQIEFPVENEGNADNLEGKGRDLDAESTCQNFRNIAKQGDLSPRYLDKGKSVGRGKKGQPKENVQSVVPGVQTRRTLSKSNN
ncbi:PREDICTED: uncharacterized protein LOC109235805 [Nicotiana attenuata]|uniref:uncharacterized protein LOC109235805 n=1 Tax=Nicotiana attenuata TaxID=49451 RepID=UPI0009051FF7|nr:PREDICTED: uncharacterized protein LOC109235805 [Nicotiana attenuata]